MKKFYTVLAALCGAAMVANAAAPIKNIEGTYKMPQALTMAAPMQVANVAGNHFNAPVRFNAPTATQLDGKRYMNGAYIASGQTLAYEDLGLTQIVMVDEKTVEVTGIMSVNYTWTCKYDAEKGTITIPKDETFTLNFSNGSSAEVCVYVQNMDGNTYTTKEDLVLTVDFENRTMDWVASDDGQYFTSYCTLAQVDGQPGYGYIFAYRMMWDEINSMCVGYGYDEETLDKDEEQQTGFYMYQTYRKEGDNGFVVFTNVGGFGTFNTPVEFAIDHNDELAYVDNQVVATFNDNGNPVDVYMMNATGSTNLTFQVLVETAETGELMSLMGTNGAVYFATAQNQVADLIYDPLFVAYDIDILNPTGVKDVNIDNSNAPVEYFNLQGVRVNNPENGLYIRRQGSEATKVMVK